jgi:hypothetical protein
MSKFNHLKRAVKIIREHHQDEIDEACNPYDVEEGYPENDFTWFMKNWTIQFTKSKTYESVVAYKAKDELTDYSNYITLEARQCEWKELV